MASVEKVFCINVARLPPGGFALWPSGLALLAALVVAPGVAQASEEPQPFTIGPKPVWYALAGVTGGGSLVAHDRGGYAGGEASLLRLSTGGRFFGFYGDGYRDFGAERTYATAGLELGYKLLGVEAGGASRWGGGRPEWGAAGRLFVTLGALSVYGRYLYFAGSLSSNNAHVVQVGALLKVPIAVWGT